MTDYPENSTSLSVSSLTSLSPPPPSSSPKNYLDLNPSTSKQHTIKNVPNESAVVASELLPISNNSYTIIGTRNERVEYVVGETEKIQTDQSNLLTYLKYNNNNNNNNNIDGTITPTIRNPIDIHNHDLTMLNNDCDIAGNIQQLNVIQPILECDANKLKDNNELNQNAMISNDSGVEESTVGINRDYEKSEKVLLWNPIMNVINESQNIINNHDIGMDVDDHNVNIMDEVQNDIQVPYSVDQIKNDIVDTKATVPDVAPIENVSNDMNVGQKQNDNNNVLNPIIENYINSSITFPYSNNNLATHDYDKQPTAPATICDTKDTTTISMSETTKMPLVDCNDVNDVVKINKEIEPVSGGKDETEAKEENNEKNKLNVEIEEKSSFKEEKIDESSLGKQQDVCKNIVVKPHQHYKKRRRIVRLMGEENEQSSDDEVEKIERERVLKTASPPLPTTIEPQSASSSSPPPPPPPLPQLPPPLLSPLTIEELQQKVIIENEKPGPKSKKQSTLLLKELQTRALLQNAIRIPSVDKVKGGRKNRVIVDDDDDYEDYSIGNADGIGLPENDYEDIGRTGNDDSDLSQSQCVLINENSDLHCESMIVNEINDIVIPIENPIIPQDFDDDYDDENSVNSNEVANNDDDVDEYNDDDEDDCDDDNDNNDDDNYNDEESHSNDDDDDDNDIDYKVEQDSTNSKVKKLNATVKKRANPRTAAATKRNFRNIQKKDINLKKSTKNDEPSKKVISNNMQKPMLKRKFDVKDSAANSTKSKIIKSNPVNKPQTKSIINPTLNIQYKPNSPSSDTDDEHIPNEIYFGTPDKIPYCPPKRNPTTGRSAIAMTMADQSKTRPTNTAIRGGGAFNRGSSRSNKPPIKNQYVERSTSSSSDSDTKETNQIYNRSKHKAQAKRPQTHQHLQRFQQQQQQQLQQQQQQKHHQLHHKQNPTSNQIKKVVNPRFIPNDIYFGDIEVPLHILHAYDSVSSDEESKKVSTYIPVLPTVPNKITNNNNNNRKVVTTNVIKIIANNRNTAIKKPPSTVQKSRNVMPTTNNQKTPNRSKGGGGNGGGGGGGRRRAPAAAKKRSRSRVTKSNNEDDEEITDEKRVKIMKNYLKEAGMFRFNYSKLFEGCTSDKERADKILELLREKGLEGEPTLSKCRQLKKEIQTKKEIEELDTNLIIQGNTTRRSARAATHRNYVFEDDDDFVTSRRLPPPPPRPRPLPPPPAPEKSSTSTSGGAVPQPDDVDHHDHDGNINYDDGDGNESNVSSMNNEGLETLNKLRNVIDSDTDE